MPNDTSAEYDLLGNKYKRLKRTCSNCRDNTIKAWHTLKKVGFKLKVLERPKSHMFKRVRDVTHKEHGITKPYKGVYACIICGIENIYDNEYGEGDE